MSQPPPFSARYQTALPKQVEGYWLVDAEQLNVGYN